MSNEITDETIKDLECVLRAVMENVTDEAADSAEPKYMYAPFKRFIYNCATMYIKLLEDMSGRPETDLTTFYDGIPYTPEEERDMSTAMDEEQFLTRQAAVRLQEMFKPSDNEERTD
jgi:hypothetical protein